MITTLLWYQQKALPNSVSHLQKTEGKKKTPSALKTSLATAMKWASDSAVES
jgi:hypothetical protein